MRPERLQSFVAEKLRTAGAVRVQTLAEAGDTKHPYGVAVATATSESRWQIIGQLASGERHDDGEAPAQGEPPPWNDSDDAADPEAWVAAAIGRAESSEIASIERWSARDDQPTTKGLTLTFHNGARAFVRQL